SVSRNLITGTGTYNVRATEAAREKKQSSVDISVMLLDHTEVVLKVNKRDRGQVLLDKVFQHLRVAEIKFFGLQFPNDVPDTMRWLDPSKSIRKQFKRGYPYILFFRVKFYATDLSTMKDEFTRYQLFMQIKLDLLERRIKCSPSAAASIAALAVQSELGDYNSTEHKDDYVSEFRFIPNQTDDFKSDVARLHKMHRGLSPSQAEYQFIKQAQKLEMYGVEMHHAKDNDDEDLDVGVTSTGMLLFQNGFKINEFRWSAIVKISFKRKQFYVQLRSGPKRESNHADPISSFHMDNYRACKRLWKSCVDFHSFYRLDRCMKQEEEMARQEKHLFSFLTPSGKKGRGSEETVDDMAQHRRYLRSRAGSTKSKENMSLPCNGDRRSEDKAPRRLSAPPSVSYGVGEARISDEKMLAMLQHQHSFIQSTHSPSRNAPVVNSNYEANNNIEIPAPVKIPIQYHAADPALAASYRTLHLRPETAGEADETAASEFAPTQNGIPNDLVIVRIQPDSEGRYGFNVNGGADQNLPVIVSKVAQGSPAAMCIPPLNEGDQVLQINGRDISAHSHEQVVRFIRSTREHTGHLVLLVRPPEQPETEIPTEPVLDYDGPGDEGALLERSMQWLEDMLDSGQILAMFDELYRKKPGSTMNDAKLPQNVTKNRYRDISPYDNTRVILNGIADTDYINANYVNMFVPGSNWTNRYIASQGPLPNTSFDFWEMIWEQQSTLIVMLTTVVERGRPKCHQYWPDSETSVQFGPFIVESVSEEVTPSFAFRDFKLYKCKEDAEMNGNEVSEARDIRQMQYIAWPDHGVPDDSSDFLDFVLRVRQNRVGMAIPTTVHCSAGIGRTGVLITMETAMCLIEANQAVYPVEIARSMRDQRAMMIQTPSQFKFVCDAILRVYKEGLARPMYDDD
uniref:Tyrosine-protein phosphatase n=1 Tax=Ciona savignyi TaxID=51511 RepID=H2Z2Q2_CIOSA